MASGNATVKAVLSGDTLVLLGRASGGPPPELQLSLSGLVAPKVARGPGTSDENWGWESRCFLRALAVGKAVSFKVDYKAGQRNFGTVTLNGETLNLAVVREGWARLRPEGREGGGGPTAENSGIDEALRSAASSAEAARKGVYATPGAAGGRPRDVQWTAGGPGEAEALVAASKVKPLRMLIEHIRDGSNLRALKLDTMSMVNFSLTGIQCPRVNSKPAAAATAEPATNGASAEGEESLPVPPPARTAAGAAAGAPTNAPEPYAIEARNFVETRLLNREVDVVMEGVDRYGNLFGSVLHPAGSITVELLQNGLARMVDFSSAFVSRDVAMAMRAAEQSAKSRQLALWRGWSAPVITGAREYMALAIEVHSGDQLTVVVGGGGGAPGSGPREEKRIALASARAPRVGNARRSVADEPYASESKAALRAKVVGKIVKVTVEYEREVPQGDGPPVRRSFATVEVGKPGSMKNVAELMALEGMLGAVHHKKDEPRSQYFDVLSAAEATAVAGKKGMHSPNPPPPNRTADLTGDAKKAKQYLPHLQRSGVSRAIVEFVFSGSRFKITVPKENVSFMMALNSVRCPQIGRDGRDGDPCAEEAKAFARDAVLQRDVEVDVTDMDKNGVALGQMWHTTSAGRTDFAVSLLVAGYARTDERATYRLPGPAAAALATAEAQAQAANVGIWTQEARAAAAAANGKDDSEDLPTTSTLSVKLSDIEDGGHFRFHLADDPQLAQVEAKMKELFTQVGTAGAPIEPRRGTQCAALFDAGDGSGPAWNRVKVEGGGAPGKPDGTVTVRYIDHGNLESVPRSKLRPLDRSYFAVPGQAKEAVLAFTRVPSLEEEYGRDAAGFLHEVAWGRNLTARVLGRDPTTGAASVALYLNDGDQQSIQELLIQEGLSRVARGAERSVASPAAAPGAADLVKRLREAQERAHKGRVAMWRYGDCASDDES